MLLCAVSVVLAGQQPQHRAFALLEAPPDSSEEAQALLKQQAAIRAGLLNAYLAPARYVSAVGVVYHVRTLFMEAFDLSEKAALPVQQAYEVVARPVLYEPVEPVERDGYAWRWDSRAFREEPAKAAEMYEAFFDESIVDGEREHEDVGETLPEPGVTAVPEPEEWLLLAVGAGMLLWYARKRWPGLLRRRAV